MGAVALPGAVSYRTFVTKLRPAGFAMPANTTAIVMVNHHPVTDFSVAFSDVLAKLNDDPAGLVAGDEMLSAGEFATIGMQIGTTHAGRLNFKDNVARPWGRVYEFSQLDLPVSQKSDANHCSVLLVVWMSGKSMWQG